MFENLDLKIKFKIIESEFDSNRNGATIPQINFRPMNPKASPYHPYLKLMENKIFPALARLKKILKICY